MLNILYVGWDIETVESLARVLEDTGHRLISTYKNDHALFHDGRRVQRIPLAALLHHPLEYLIQRECRHEQRLCVFDGRLEVTGVRAAGEIFQPRRRVNDVHTRSSSRGTAVSIRVPARPARIV